MDKSRLEILKIDKLQDTDLIFVINYYEWIHSSFAQKLKNYTKNTILNRDN